jgi:hypothetical protein
MDIPESLVSSLFLVFIVLVFTLITIFSLWRYKVIRRLMQQQAMKRGGSVTGSFLVPVLKLSYHGLPIVITSVPGSRYRVAKTEVHITLHKPAPAELKIIKESLGTRLGKAFGSSDVQLNSDEFDREFLIQTADESLARNILDFAVQEKLLKMKEEKPRITLQGTSLGVSVPKVIKSEERYDELFDLVFCIMDRVLAPSFHSSY